MRVASIILLRLRASVLCDRQAAAAVSVLLQLCGCSNPNCVFDFMSRILCSEMYPYPIRCIQKDVANNNTILGVIVCVCVCVFVL